MEAKDPEALLTQTSPLSRQIICESGGDAHLFNHLSEVSFRMY